MQPEHIGEETKKSSVNKSLWYFFPKTERFTEYLELLEEAKKRDHRKLGKELGIFAFSEKVGQGYLYGCQKELL
jgi:threonyl-tRNA synthetase